jgi:hypothetical protein
MMLVQARIGEPHFPGMVPVIKKLFLERGGWRGVYRGAGINFARSIVSWGIINAMYEALSPSVLGLPSSWAAAPAEHPERVERARRHVLHNAWKWPN